MPAEMLATLSKQSSALIALVRSVRCGGFDKSVPGEKEGAPISCTTRGFQLSSTLRKPLLPADR
jgi:hypothetical protein